METSTVVIQKDLSYLEEGRSEKMDVYLPGACWQRPLSAVLLIHGGGWRVGDKASKREQNMANDLAAAGYAVFSINYLLNEGYKDSSGVVHTTKVAWPRNLLDCQHALQFLQQESGRFEIDPDRIGVMGESAGGTFALLLAATSELEPMGGSPGHRVCCCIDFYGVTQLGYDRRREIFSGASREETDKNIWQATPMNWITSESPPILVVHGGADTGIVPDESRDLVKCLREVGVPYWYVEIGGAPHSFDLQPEQMDLRPVVCGFLARHLGDPVLKIRA